MEGAIVRRVIPSDNSCLFNAVGYVMDHSKTKASELRQVIASTVASDPSKFSEAILGKTNGEYCSWILNPEKWGGEFERPPLRSLSITLSNQMLDIVTPIIINEVGKKAASHKKIGDISPDCCISFIRLHRCAIELSILAEFYGREIAAYDIQTTRCDLYGQEKNYQERVMLIYDGLHYDALAMSPAEGAPEEFDQTIFVVDKDRTIGVAERLALNLVKDQQRKRSFTNTANFTLRCGVCQIGVIGEKGAMEHAQATGHVNFQEYK